MSEPNLTPEIESISRHILAQGLKHAAELIDLTGIDRDRCRQLNLTEQAWAEAMDACSRMLRERAHQLSPGSVSEICRRTHVQACHICDDAGCGDNMNPTLRKPADEPRPPQP